MVCEHLRQLGYSHLLMKVYAHTHFQTIRALMAEKDTNLTFFVPIVILPNIQIPEYVNTIRSKIYLEQTQLFSIYVINFIYRVGHVNVTHENLE